MFRESFDYDAVPMGPDSGPHVVSVAFETVEDVPPIGRKDDPSRFYLVRAQYRVAIPSGQGGHYLTTVSGLSLGGLDVSPCEDEFDTVAPDMIAEDVVSILAPLGILSGGSPPATDAARLLNLARA